MHHPQFTHAELDNLDVSGDKIPDSQSVVQTFSNIDNVLDKRLSETDWYQRYSWEQNFSTPYIGPSNPTESSYIWLGLIDEHYASLPRASNVLQLEFGVDAGAATGFLNREVMWGILLGRWANDDIYDSVQQNLDEFSHLFEHFLADNDEYMMVTKTGEYESPNQTQIEDIAADTDSELAVTRDLRLFDLPEIDVVQTVCQTLADLTPLYRVLADITHAPPIFVPTNVQDTGNYDTVRLSKAWDVDSLAQATSLSTDRIQSNVDWLIDSGCAEQRAIEYVRRYLKDMLRGQGLFAVSGIGPSSGRMLVEAGVTSIEDLQASDPQKLAGRTDLSLEKIEEFQQNVKTDDYRSLEPENEEVAEQLLASEGGTAGTTITSSNSQSESTETEEKSTDTSESASTLDLPSAISRNEPEILGPEELPVPDKKHTTTDGTIVYPNYLSEFYESIQEMKTVLECVFQIPGTDIEPNDQTDPRVQYFILLDACTGFGDASTRFTGYGPQHQNRVPFSIDNYRELFGDGQTVTDYQIIGVESFSQESHELLQRKANIRSSREFVRPCVPGTDIPLLELPGTFDELQNAMQCLRRFPAYPPLPDENGTSSQFLPIADIYQTCFSELDSENRVALGPVRTDESSTPTGPVTEATPTSQSEAASKLVDYGRLSHLHRRVTPPSRSPTEMILDVFALDWYHPDSQSFEPLQALAKYGEDDPVDTFRPRLRDLIHRRFILDDWEYDYITVFPGHEAESLSSQLVSLARDAVLETETLYTPLLERTQTVNRQRNKSKNERQEIVINPSESLRSRYKFDGETVLLFDDVCTTGSSLVAGSYLLRQAGAHRVVGLTLGLTPGGPRESVSKITDPNVVASDVIAGVNK